MRGYRFNLIIGCAVWLAGMGVVSPGGLTARGVGMETGARIRIKTPLRVKHFYGWREEGSPWITGRLVQMEEGFVRMQPEESAKTITVPRDSVFRMEKSFGKTAWPRRGLLFGGLIGAAIGAGIAGATDADDVCGGEGFFSCAKAEFAYGVQGFMIGALVGILAAHYFKIEDWKRVEGWDHRYSMELRAAPTGRQVKAGFVVGF